MKRILFGAILALLIVFGIRYCTNQNNEHEQLLESSALIERQIRNVGKLVVSEGTFSQVYSYKDSKQFYLDVLSANKKALIVVNTEVSIAYDLSKMEVEIDEEKKTLLIKDIPEAEISINPDIQYYDITQDYLNQFEAEDYNKIKEHIDKSIREKIENSILKSNAKNRLISELQKLYILTNSMGWTLKYHQEVVESPQEMEKIKL